MSRTAYESGGLKWRNCIRPVRETRGISGAELARRAGMRRQNLHKLEQHQREPSVGVLLRLAAALDCTLDDLIDVETGPGQKFTWFCGDLRRVTPGDEGEQP